jgi:hypothetical protein
LREEEEKGHGAPSFPPLRHSRAKVKSHHLLTLSLINHYHLSIQRRIYGRGKQAGAGSQIKESHNGSADTYSQQDYKKVIPASASRHLSAVTLPALNKHGVSS